jgi:hypothetical protein
VAEVVMEDGRQRSKKPQADIEKKKRKIRVE